MPLKQKQKTESVLWDLILLFPSSITSKNNASVKVYLAYKQSFMLIEKRFECVEKPGSRDPQYKLCHMYYKSLSIDKEKNTREIWQTAFPINQ